MDFQKDGDQELQTEHHWQWKTSLVITTAKTAATNP